MITSHDILDKTGLKSAKTLTRWHQRGLIPEPLIRTHPSGRGKVAYWPDWVLNRCLRIVELQREGHSLQSAASVLGVQDLGSRIERGGSIRSFVEGLKDKKLQVATDREVSVYDACLFAMVASVKSRLLGASEQTRLTAKLREGSAV